MSEVIIITVFATVLALYIMKIYLDQKNFELEQKLARMRHETVLKAILLFRRFP